MLIVLYLTAIVAANLLVARFGPGVTVLNAFLFIGLDITTRDALHERWSRRGLVWKMGALILTGSVLSAALNWGAARIALASCLAFGGSAAVDTLTYTLLHERAWAVKVNGSNVVSAAVDSILFPAFAFGFPLLLGVMAGQFVAKVAGGFLWFLILRRVRGALAAAV